MNFTNLVLIILLINSFFRESWWCSRFSKESHGWMGGQDMHSICEENQWEILFEILQKYSVSLLPLYVN